MWSLLLTVVLIPVAGTYAGRVNPELLEQLEAASQQEMIDVVIEVSGGISAAELNAYLDTTCETLSDRRREGVLLLQERARTTQVSLLAALGRLEQSGLVKNVASHWLTNTVTADVVNAEVVSVAELPDVVEVFQYPAIVPIEPTKCPPPASRATMAAGGVEENLKCIGADSAWRMGYTGLGRVVCHFDGTGVDGKHPALINNWKGNDGNPDAAWDGLWTEDGYPACDWPGPLGAHGTHITGILCGHDDLTGDTVGVAPGATWIGGPGHAYEWAADPDGNPYTTDDVPDVINISNVGGWPCYGWPGDEIDMVEALGTVVVFAAGNVGGEGPLSVQGPANRARDSLDNFAVGSIRHESGLIWWSSSRGPSKCDSISIKPNVATPGASIRSCVQEGLYDYHGGTSMAAPHVAGAVAILRQYAPNASVREIKEALLAGCTPRGSPHPNNDYGWGVINIPASIEFLSSQFEADVHTMTFYHEQVVLRDTIGGEIVLRNRGYPVDSVYLRFADDHDGLSVLTDSIYFGPMDRNQTADGDIPYKLVFDDTLYAGAVVSVGYTVYGSGGYQKRRAISIQAGIEGERSTFVHDNGRMQLIVSNYGVLSDFRSPPRTSRNWIYDASLMIGTDYAHVSDNFPDENREDDEDFWYDACCGLMVDTPGSVADQQTSCAFDDGRAENRLGVQVTQNTYSWDTSPYDRFIVLEYVLENISRRIIEGLSVGLALDWSMLSNNYDRNCESNLARADNLGFLFRYGETDSASFRGAVVLNEEGVTSYRVITHDVTSYGPTHISTLSDSAKYAALAGGFIDTNLVTTINENMLHVIATGPFTLSPGELDTAYFAVMGAESLTDLKSTSTFARDKVHSLLQSSVVPSTFVLRQNYPNPFNPTTVIEYSLPIRADVSIDIFNILGQRVRRLVHRSRAPGSYSVTWDGTDGAGRQLATGVYLYRLRAGDHTEAKKMLLLK
jgi:subtilisin family serine protease